MTKSSICGKIALQDQYGNGEFKNCGLCHSNQNNPNPKGIDNVKLSNNDAGVGRYLERYFL